MKPDNMKCIPIAKNTENTEYKKKKLIDKLRKEGTLINKEK